MNYGASFQKNIDKYMEEEGISHNSVAKKSGVSQKTVWSVASGRSVPSLNTAEIVAKALGLDVRILLGSEIDAKQVGRSARIGRILDDLISLTPEQLSTVQQVISAFSSTK